MSTPDGMFHLLSLMFNTAGFRSTFIEGHFRIVQCFVLSYSWVFLAVFWSNPCLSHQRQCMDVENDFITWSFCNWILQGLLLQQDVWKKKEENNLSYERLLPVPPLWLYGIVYKTIQQNVQASLIVCSLWWPRFCTDALPTQTEHCALSSKRHAQWHGMPVYIISVLPEGSSTLEGCKLTAQFALYHAF